MHATVVVGRQGRLVIPAALRAAWGLQPGELLSLTVRGKQLVLERPGDAVFELQRLASVIPPDRSLVDELLSQRRAAAAAE